MKFEKDNYDTRYVYGHGRIYQKVTKAKNEVEEETEVTPPTAEEILKDGAKFVVPDIWIATEGFGTSYLHKNIIGTTEYMTSENGKIISKPRYDEWGSLDSDKVFEMNFAGLDDVNNYTGHSYDGVIKVYFAQARVYEPDVRRFLAEDIIKDGFNWYSYVDGNPVNYLDPDGKQREAGYFNGKWYKDPDAAEFEKNSDTYKIIDALGAKWKKSNSGLEKIRFSVLADHARKRARNGAELLCAQDKINKLLKSAASEMGSYAKEINQQISYMTEISCYASENLVYTVLGLETNKLENFYNSVKTGSKYDIKSQKEWQWQHENENPTATPFMYYDGEFWTSKNLGNYAFGYYGAAYGYSLEFILAGAGAYQIYSGTSNYKWIDSYFDDPNDQFQIEKGYEKFIKDFPGYSI